MNKQYLIILLIIFITLTCPLTIFGANHWGYPETEFVFVLCRYVIDYTGRGVCVFTGYYQENIILSILWFSLGLLLGMVLLFVLRNQLSLRISWVTNIAIIIIQILFPYLASTFLISQGPYYHITYVIPIPIPAIIAILILIQVNKSRRVMSSER